VCAERSTWTDERLDDMVARHDSQFDLLRADNRDLRAEIHAMRLEMQAEFRAVRRGMFNGAIAFFGSQVALLGMMVAVLVSG
jgi:hypothetical protein